MRLSILILLLTTTAAGAQGYFPARPFFGMPSRDFPLPPSPPPKPYRFTGQIPQQRNIPRPRPDAQAREIESEILTFCDNHGDEPFCAHLGSYLRKHGMVP
jgi:hypothetical protein